MAGWFPQFKLLVAFNNAVFDDPALITSTASPPGTLGANNVWTDITADVRDNIDTSRGKQHEVDRFQPGTLTATLDNRAGKYDPWSVTSPYAGLVEPGKPVRLTATDPNTSTVTNLYTGVTDIWNTVWTDPRYGTVQLSCVDQFAYLSNVYITSLYAKTVLADTPAIYLRMGDPSGSGTAADSSGNGHPAPVAPGCTFGEPGTIANDPTTSVFLAWVSGPTGYINVPAAGAITGGSGAFTVEAWYNVTSWATTAPAVLYDQSNVSGSIFLQLFVSNAGILQFIDQQASVTDLSVESQTAIPADGLWHHVVATSASPYLYIDGQSVATTVVANTGLTVQSPAVGWVGQYGAGPAWPGYVQEFALYNTSLSASRVLAHYQAGAAAPIESSGARVLRVLQWQALPTAHANLDIGKSQIQSPTSSLSTTDALSYLQAVEQTELGALFMDGSGQLRLLSRDTVYTTVASTVTFGDGGGSEIPFELGPTIATDTLDFYTKVSVTRNGGNAQLADSGVAGKTLQLAGLLQTNDTECAGMAYWLLAQLSIPPKPRVRAVTVHPVVTPAGAATTAILPLDLMSVVTVHRVTLPGAGTAFLQISNVEGIEHHVLPATGDWTVILHLTPLAPNRPWILGTSQLGTDTTLFF